MDIKIVDLCVKVKDKEILNNFNLNINSGEIHVIMGPNGVGKSTLSKVIMGNSDYDVVSGDILVNGKSIKDLDVSQRAKLGIFLSFQNPLEIEGVTNSEFLKTMVRDVRDSDISLYDFIKEVNVCSEELEFNKDMLHRHINQNFSGGEKKKNEILQMKMLRPKFIILDELDSGLDVDSLHLVCSNINKYLEDNPSCAVLIITHYTRLLKEIVPDYVHVLKDGKIVYTGDSSLAEKIEKSGYKVFDNGTSNIAEDTVYE